MENKTKQLTSEQKKYIKKFCYKYRITEEQYFGREWIFGIVEIFESKIPEWFNPKIGGGCKGNIGRFFSCGNRRFSITKFRKNIGKI